MTMITEPESTTSTEVPPPSTEQPAAPQAPFAAAAKVVHLVQLSSVRFHTVSARTLDPSQQIPDDVSLAATTRFLTPTVSRTESGFSTVTTLLFKLRSDGDDAAAAYAVIQATIEATYAFKAEDAAVSEDELKDYALCYCPFHVWGYWREWVQSSLARLDLPQFTLPLFLISQAPKLVQDSLE